MNLGDLTSIKNCLSKRKWLAAGALIAFFLSTLVVLAVYQEKQSGFKLPRKVFLTPAHSQWSFVKKTPRDSLETVKSQSYCQPDCPEGYICVWRPRCLEWGIRKTQVCVKYDENGCCILYDWKEIKTCVEYDKNDQTYVCVKRPTVPVCPICSPTPALRLPEGHCSCLRYTWSEHPWRLRASKAAQLSFLLEAKATGERKVTAASVVFQKPDGQTQAVNAKKIETVPCPPDKCYLIEIEPLIISAAGKYTMISGPALKCE